MKRISRMVIFSGVALFLTALWNKGFEANFEPSIFVKTVLLVAIFYYLVIPLTKLILLPINLITLGLVSSVVYFLLFYLFITRFSLISISPWDFSGLSLFGFSIGKMHIGYITNMLLSSVSLSFIIQLQEVLI